MTEPGNFVLAFLRRLDETFDGISADVRELEGRSTNVVEHLAKLELSISGVNRRIDRVGNGWSGSDAASTSSRHPTEKAQ